MKITEIFGITIQGEGILSGIPAVFIRLAGCNSNVCSFCDTEFSCNSESSVEDIIYEVKKYGSPDNFIVVITGGEPLLQLEELHQLIIRLSELEYFIQIETNGSLPLKITSPNLVVCCSPKVKPKDIMLEYCHCVKFLYPYLKGINPESFKDHYFITNSKIVRFLQPIDTQNGIENNNNEELAIQEVKRLGIRWKLGLQIHKIIGEK